MILIFLPWRAVERRTPVSGNMGIFSLRILFVIIWKRDSEIADTEAPESSSSV